jgi:hypothetical protein
MTLAPSISFEPFPKSGDLFMKRAVPYPPLPQKKAPHPQAGFSLFGRGAQRQRMGESARQKKRPQREGSRTGARSMNRGR